MLVRCGLLIEFIMHVQVTDPHKISLPIAILWHAKHIETYH